MYMGSIYTRNKYTKFDGCVLHGDPSMPHHHDCGQKPHLIAELIAPPAYAVHNPVSSLTCAMRGGSVCPCSTKRRGREECHAESRAAGAALEARRQREAEAVEVEMGAAAEDDGDASSWWDRRVWNWHKGYVPADGRPAPLPADALQGEDADIGQVYEVDKCRWDHAYGCGAFSARLSWESVAHACAVELAPAVAESDRLGEALSVQEALRARAARQCTALSHSEVACRSALGGACVWLPPPPPPSSPWPPTPKQYRGLGLDAPQPYVKPRLRKYQPPPMPPPPPPAPHYGYDEPGACQLSSDGHALRPLHALLDCEAAGGLLAAWADYSRGLRDVCGTADTAHACKLLATSGEQPCVWAHRVCRPSVAPLLGALAGEGPVIATKLAACEAMDSFDGKTCTAPPPAGHSKLSSSAWRAPSLTSSASVAACYWGRQWLVGLLLAAGTAAALSLQLACCW